MCVCVLWLSRVWVFVTLWTLGCQAPLSMGFSKQGYQSQLPFPTPGHFPDSGIKTESLASLTLAGGFFTTAPPWKLYSLIKKVVQLTLFKPSLTCTFPHDHCSSYTDDREHKSLIDPYIYIYIFFFFWQHLFENCFTEILWNTCFHSGRLFYVEDRTFFFFFQINLLVRSFICP